MKKSDLKNLMRVRLRKGEMFIVVELNDELLLYNQAGHMSLESYDEQTLLHKTDFRYDVMNVYTRGSLKDLFDRDEFGDCLFERKEYGLDRDILEALRFALRALADQGGDFEFQRAHQHLAAEKIKKVLSVRQIPPEEAIRDEKI